MTISTAPTTLLLLLRSTIRCRAEATSTCPLKRREACGSGSLPLLCPPHRILSGSNGTDKSPNSFNRSIVHFEGQVWSPQLSHVMFEWHQSSLINSISCSKAIRASPFSPCHTGTRPRHPNDKDTQEMYCRYIISGNQWPKDIPVFVAGQFM